MKKCKESTFSNTCETPLPPYFENYGSHVHQNELQALKVWFSMGIIQYKFPVCYVDSRVKKLSKSVIIQSLTVSYVRIWTRLYLFRTFDLPISKPNLGNCSLWTFLNVNFKDLLTVYYVFSVRCW